MASIDDGLRTILAANDMKGIRIRKTLLISSNSWRFGQLHPYEPKAYNSDKTLVVCVDGWSKSEPQRWNGIDKRLFDGYSDHICVAFPDTFPRQHPKESGPLTMNFDVKYVKNLSALRNSLPQGMYIQL